MLGKTKNIPLSLGISNEILREYFVFFKYFHRILSFAGVSFPKHKVNSSKTTFAKLLNNLELVEAELAAI